MASEVKLPRLGQGMEAGTIVRWLKTEGEPVEKGEPLYELDTDKVTQEVEAEASGVLLKIAIPEGEVPVGRTIAYIGEAGEEVAAEADVSSDGKATAEVAPAAPEAEAEREPAPAEPATSDAGEGRLKASPLARRIARERSLDLASIAGTGPDGRIVAEDVERAAAAAPAPARAPAPEPAPAPAVRPEPAKDVEVERLSSTRRTIARRLTEAWQAPVFHLFVSADMTRANALLASLRELHPDARPTMTDLLVRVAGAALMRHPQVNAQLHGDEVHRFPTANVGIAVAAPAGLVVPVLRSVERRTIAEIAAERAAVVGRARDGKLQREDLEGGTFTISNLGMYGIERFTAVLNPPQVAIVAVGATADRAVVVDGGIVVRPKMDLTLTCDHRALDGAVAAEFLRTLEQFLEEPALTL